MLQSRKPPQPFGPIYEASLVAALPLFLGLRGEIRPGPQTDEEHVARLGEHFNWAARMAAEAAAAAERASLELQAKAVTAAEPAAAGAGEAQAEEGRFAPVRIEEPEGGAAVATFPRTGELMPETEREVLRRESEISDFPSAFP